MGDTTSAAPGEESRRAVRRLQRPGWRDLRLVIGVLLVLVSVAGGARLVAGLDDSTPVYVAARDLLPGQPVEERDVVVVTVPTRLGEPLTHYVDASRPLSDDTYLVRAVQAGELVPASALGTERQALDKTVTVPVDASALDGLSSGSVVDLWVSQRDDDAVGEAYLDPGLLLAGAVVDSVPEQGGALGTSLGRASVAVVVPADRVGEVIGAVDQGARITLVPAPRSTEETGR